MINIGSWNVNSINARIDRFTEFVKKAKPDVLCLQEIKTVEDNFPWEAISELGYEVAVYGQKAYNGVAILSRFPMKKISKGFAGPKGDESARVISAEIKGITVICAYVPNGQEVGSEKFLYKLEWLKKIRKHLDSKFTPDSNVVMLGDFNIAPDDRDVYDPDKWRGKIHFSEPEHKALKHLMDFGFEDTFRKFEKDGGHYSWWDYRHLSFQKDRGLRIDFVLATPPLMESCTRAWIERDVRKGEKPSDHVPVFAEFKLP